MTKLVKPVIVGLARAVGTIGSLFVKVGVDGKLNVAIAPVTLLLVFCTGVTCAVQNSEPFSTCIQGTARSFKELVNAY